MPLSLSSEDQRRLNAATVALQMPLRFPSADVWRQHVNDAVKSLIGGDRAIFFLPSDESADGFSDEYPPDVLVTLFDRIDPLASQCGRSDALVSRGCTDRATLWGDRLSEYYRSDYWQQVALPLQAHDALMLTLPVGRTPSKNRMAQIILNRCGTSGPFGERGLALGSMLMPSMEFGVRTWSTFGHVVGALGRMVDQLGTAAALYSMAGRELHVNAAGTSLLAALPDPAEVSRAARHLVTKLRPGAVDSSPNPCQISINDVLVRATKLAAEHAEMDGLVLVTFDAARTNYRRLCQQVVEELVIRHGSDASPDRRSRTNHCQVCYAGYRQDARVEHSHGTQAR
jgi:hypothetical protein